MTVDEAINYLNSLNRFGSVLGLDNMRRLLLELSNPQESLKIIHVTGTNGKGSTCAFLSGILTAAGYKTGMYNSPAVICEYDQYKLNGEIVEESLFADAVTEVKKACDRLNETGVFPTRFEVETAAAFVLFKNAGVDIAIIETGLGGKDDATCVIENAVMHVITSISEDHIPVLGENISEIADNKSHIIKSDAPTVVYKTCSETYDIIKRRCDKYKSPLYYVNQPDISNIKYTEKGTEFCLRSLHNSIFTPLAGVCQPLNAALAIKAAEVLSQNTDFTINQVDIINGIKKAYIPFRFEKLSDSPVIIADGAHNPDGAKKLIESLNFIYEDRNFIFVIGIFKDKDYEAMCRLTGHTAKQVYAVMNDRSDRALDAAALANILKIYNDNVSVCGTIEEGVDGALNLAGNDQSAVIVLFGSLSWLYRAKQYLTDRGSAQEE